MIIKKDYKNHKWIIESEYLDEPVHISFFDQILDRLPYIQNEIRENKIKEILKNKE